MDEAGVARCFQSMHLLYVSQRRAEHFPRRVAERLHFHIHVRSTLSEKIKTIICIVVVLILFVFAATTSLDTFSKVSTQGGLWKLLNVTCGLCCNVSQWFSS